jgi:electron transfer flavoprotein alpha subunit
MSVLVYIENWDGKFKKLSFELVSYATRVAEMLGTNITAISIGQVPEAELSKLAGFGATRIINIPGEQFNILDNQIFTTIISEFARKENARVVILSNNNTGKALAPRLAVKLQAGLGAGVSRLPISVDPFIVYKKTFSGNAFANLHIKSEIKVLTLAQNSFELIEKPVPVAIEQASVQLNPGMIKVKDVQKQTGKILLTDAEIVVSGGRGMKSADNWGPIIELAGILGAALACSRPVSDEGWRSHEEHAGQTGKIISPNLYIAIGISGATQHLAGVSGSKFIVAVNTDKDAPIFEAAQYGIIGDAQKVLPKLVEAFREVKGR